MKVTRRQAVIGGVAVTLGAALWRGNRRLKTREPQVVIVGSGASAVAVATALIASRIPVLLLESGPDASAPAPKEGAPDEPFETENGTLLSTYDVVGAEFQWFRARQVGGKLNHWSGHCPRFSASDFEEGKVLSPELSWPISYEELSPYYAIAERILHVSGRADHLSESPDGEFERIVEKTPREELLASALGQFGIGITPGRYAHFSALACLRALAADENFALVTNATVVGVELKNATNAVAGVTVYDRGTASYRTVPARKVVLAAGALESAVILLNSVSDRYPTGLGNVSQTLGRNLMDHLCIDATATMPRIPDAPRAEPFFAPRFNRKALINDDKSVFGGWQYSLGLRDGGQVSAVGFGAMLPDMANRIELTGRKTSKGMPIPRIVCHYGANDRALLARMRDVTRGIVDKVSEGGKVSGNFDYRPGHAIHQAGTCRMGRDKRTSMLDSFCRSHEVSGLIVADAGSFVTLPEKNPTLTMFALALRAGERLANDLRGNA